MHRGRFVPRLPEQVLSEDVVVPYFAPESACPIFGSFNYQGQPVDFNPINFRPGEVDPANLSIEYHGWAPGAPGAFFWRIIQDREGTPTPLRIRVIVDAPNGDRWTLTSIPPVNHWGWGYSVPSWHEPITVVSTGGPWDFLAAGYAMRGYR